MSDPVTEQEERQARQALALLMAGDEDAGLAAYERALVEARAHRMPVGLHLLLLERAGRDETAARLRSLALRRSGNIVFKGVAVEGSREEAAEEYEALIARGLVNIRMIEAYLVLLARLGRTERLAQLCDPSRLLRIVRIGDQLSADAQEALLRHEAEARYSQSTLSVRLQRKLDRLEARGEPALVALLDLVREEGQRYLADWAASDHPLAHAVPQEFDLQAWALISRGPGFNVPHIHNRGWATGIVYPAAVHGGAGGTLRIGPPPDLDHPRDGWPDAALDPAPGLMVLMPSFYTHWTVPLDTAGLRTSIPFDFVRREWDEAAWRCGGGDK